jgi:hypothetical protein
MEEVVVVARLGLHGMELAHEGQEIQAVGVGL